MDSRVWGIVKAGVYVIVLLAAIFLHLVEDDYSGLLDLVISLYPLTMKLSPHQNGKGEG